MNPIRPTGLTPPPPPSNAAADAARLAAQRAFFDQALGRANGTPAPQPARAPQAVSAPATAAPAPVRYAPAAPPPADAEAAAKPLRPGSLLDIRV